MTKARFIFFLENQLNMAWFHKSLSEAKNILEKDNITEKDYDIVRSILTELTEHLKERIRGKINIDMRKS